MKLSANRAGRGQRLIERRRDAADVSHLPAAPRFVHIDVISAYSTCCSQLALTLALLSDSHSA
jgi:hypothetical protein